VWPAARIRGRRGRVLSLRKLGALDLAFVEQPGARKEADGGRHHGADPAEQGDGGCPEGEDAELARPGRDGDRLAPA